MLADPRAQVRSSAALGLALVDAKDIDRTTHARLALLAIEDRDPAVRAAAAFARGHRDSGTVTVAPGLFMQRAPSFAWADPPNDIEVELGSWRVWIPTIGQGAWRWALAPGFARGRARGEIETLPARDPGA